MGMGFDFKRLGLSKRQIEEMIDSKMTGTEGLTEQQINELIASRIGEIQFPEGMTSQQVQQLIVEQLQSQFPDGSMTEQDVIAAIQQYMPSAITVITEANESYQWVDYPIGTATGQRKSEVTYTNDTGYMIQLWIKSEGLASASAIQIVLDQGKATEQTFSSGSAGIAIVSSHVLGPLTIDPGQTYYVKGRKVAVWKEHRLKPE